VDSYGNRHGDSPIQGFCIGDTYIDVRFAGGDIYRYSYAKPGRDHVEVMKRLAAAGRGLATYISTHVDEGFESRR
jgi:hypothetical protein